MIPSKYVDKASFHHKDHSVHRMFRDCYNFVKEGGGGRISSHNDIVFTPVQNIIHPILFALTISSQFPKGRRLFTFQAVASKYQGNSSSSTITNNGKHDDINVALGKTVFKPLFNVYTDIKFSLKGLSLQNINDIGKAIKQVHHFIAMHCNAKTETKKSTVVLDVLFHNKILLTYCH